MRITLFAALLLVAVQTSMGQAPAAPDPCAAAQRSSFDVVSIAASETPGTSSSMNGTRDGITMTGSLRRMILRAFALHDFQVTGGPDWVSTATWVAKGKNDAPDPDLSKLSRAEMQALFEKRMQQVQSMLLDRFQLKCHMAPKEMAIYELVQAKGGSKLKLTTAPENRQNSDSSGGRGLQAFESGTGVTLDHIASQLTNDLDRIVVDKTGLAGSYDFRLDWVRDAPAASADAPSGPTIFTAIEEQLGLKLVPAKGPVPVLVIDAAEKPSQN